MEINTERDGATLIARTVGRVDGTNAAEFQDALKNVIAPEDQAVILDFEDLSYISSAGLRVILLTAKDMRTANVKLAVCSPRSRSATCLPSAGSIRYSTSTIPGRRP